MERTVGYEPTNTGSTPVTPTISNRKVVILTINGA